MSGDPGTHLGSQLRLSAPAARLVRPVAISAFALIVLAILAMLVLAGLATIHGGRVVVPVLALAAIFLFGLGSCAVLLLTHFATPYEVDGVVSSVML
jgi:hypothetical protein